jgi:hypothetical protein
MFLGYQQMNFVVTTYVYPLAQPIELSKSLKIQLDNPRTKDEIRFVEGQLKRAWESGEDYAFPIHSDEDIVTVENTLFRFHDAFSVSDSYVKKVFRRYKREQALKFLASIWIVARYDDEGESRRLGKFHARMRAKGELTFSLLDDDHPIVRGENIVCNYSYLLSLLVNSESDSYFGRGFTIADLEPTTKQDKSLGFQLLVMGMGSADALDGQIRSSDPLRWIFFPYARTEIKNKSILLEKSLSEGLADRFLYVGSMLRIASEGSRNPRIRLVILTSILELLLTRSPDSSRFNVEDSISKQFGLKVSLLVYLNDRNRNIKEIAKRLKVIYAQRSNVAHGNFQATSKYINSLSKTEGEEEYFDDLISDLYSYLRAVVEEYLKDKSLVEFLKTS